MLAKGPELRMEINEPQPSGGEFSHGIIWINIFKGKDKVFKDDIHISNLDTQKMKRFIVKNFSV
jgi:hypothetical protein